MKKRLSILFVILAVTAIFTSTAFAVPVNSKSVTFLYAEYQKGGIALFFETSGLTQEDLKNATFFAASNNQDIYCTFTDDTDTAVRCTVAKSLASMGGFKVTLAGFTFWDDLPKERAICGGTLWYTYNEYYKGELEWSGKVPVWIWEEYEAVGGFEWDAEYGWTYEITGTFCGPDFDFKEPT